MKMRGTNLNNVSDDGFVEVENFSMNS